MIKGVNKRVVEIICTDNEYFEKAVLYIKSDKPDVSAARLESEAREYVGNLAPQRRSEPIPLALKLAVASALVLLLTLIVYLVVCL